MLYSFKGIVILLHYIIIFYYFFEKKKNLKNKFNSKIQVINVGQLEVNIFMNIQGKKYI